MEDTDHSTQKPSKRERCKRRYQEIRWMPPLVPSQSLPTLLESLKYQNELPDSYHGQPAIQNLSFDHSYRYPPMDQYMDTNANTTSENIQPAEDLSASMEAISDFPDSSISVKTDTSLSSSYFYPSESESRSFYPSVSYLPQNSSGPYLYSYFLDPSPTQPSFEVVPKPIPRTQRIQSALRELTSAHISTADLIYEVLDTRKECFTANRTGIYNKWASILDRMMESPKGRAIMTDWMRDKATETVCDTVRAEMDSMKKASRLSLSQVVSEAFNAKPTIGASIEREAPTLHKVITAVGPK